MNHYSKSEIDALMLRFEARELPKPEWTHEAHIVVAVWYIMQSDFEQALDIVRENITKHNESVGTINSDTDGYHETITKFWLMVAKAFVEENEFTDKYEAINALIDSRYGKSDYPFEYYSKENLFSVKARHNWIEPDLKKLDTLAFSTR